jgi:hypothetical protein
MNKEQIHTGELKGGELMWSGHCGFLRRPDGELIPWVSDSLFKKEGFKAELVETFGCHLAVAEVLDGEVLDGDKFPEEIFSDEMWLGLTILLVSGAYMPTAANKWLPTIGGYFLLQDPAMSNDAVMAAYVAKRDEEAKRKKKWWQFGK